MIVLRRFGNGNLLRPKWGNASFGMRSRDCRVRVSLQGAHTSCYQNEDGNLLGVYSTFALQMRMGSFVRAYPVTILHMRCHRTAGILFHSRADATTSYTIIALSSSARHKTYNNLVELSLVGSIAVGNCGSKRSSFRASKPEIAELQIAIDVWDIRYFQVFSLQWLQIFIPWSIKL